MLGAWPELVVQLLVLLYKTEQAGGLVGFLWVSAHIGVGGKEGADMTAKRKSDHIIKENITAAWQKQWENENEINCQYKRV